MTHESSQEQQPGGPAGTRAGWDHKAAAEREKKINSTPMREMRVLGPYPPGDQGYAGEMRRCEAMQLAYRQ
eukprot:892917-Pyramimonas_sp.AAC.1